MTRQQIEEYLDSTRIYDIHFYTPAMAEGSSNGWKISIQGKTKEDSLFLWDRLHNLLESENIPYKIGTAKRLSLINSDDNRHKQQGHKIMTIYIPNIFSQTPIDVYNFAEIIYSKIKDYKGWYDVPTPTNYEHYAGGIFIRNDRDSAGNYVSAV